MFRHGDEEIPDALLSRYGASAEGLLGSGGEALVFAGAKDRVVRVHRRGTTSEHVRVRAALLTEIRSGARAAGLAFETPEVLDVEAVDGRFVTIEARLPGRAALDVLEGLRGRDRVRLVRSHLDAAWSIGDIEVVRPWYGDLCHPDPVRTDAFPAYLAERARRNLSRAGKRFSSIDAAGVAADLHLDGPPALVHVDAFLGNMLADGPRITAVFDFGTVSLIGDRRLDALTAAAYLDETITRTATDADRAVAGAWLHERGLGELYPAARRWIGAFWSAAGTDDGALADWCASMLGVAGRPGA